ncbi:hypothetical protein [Zavarzinia sp.]|uniref:hypothetical protein n=1 Tax=Zavarzinia sp. TaxID=2027920 RepID=UPI00356358EE
MILLSLLAVLFLAGFLAFWRWQVPGNPLSAAETARYAEAVGRNLRIPADERQGFVEAVQRFAAADDGRPVHMLNLMRYNAAIRRVHDLTPFPGTPAESNAHYEKLATAMALRSGAYPLYAGNVGDANVVAGDPALDHWSRVLVMRYPCRRAFLDLVSDPAYGEIAHYKLLALQLVLTPMKGEMVIPDLRLALGALLLGLFLAAGWLQAVMP